MDLISKEKVKNTILDFGGFDTWEDKSELIYEINFVPSTFEGMTNNEVHKAIFGFELDPRYLVTDDTCIVADEDCPVCPLYNKTCNNRNFAEWLDSPYKGVSEC